ncbi:hypothetical protein M0805_004605 [Coniferiporia weirii]|nr:hypothetical protein M0805_004605 [Coniferiporia weirii]
MWTLLALAAAVILWWLFYGPDDKGGNGSTKAALPTPSRWTDHHHHYHPSVDTRRLTRSSPGQAFTNLYPARQSGTESVLYPRAVTNVIGGVSLSEYNDLFLQDFPHVKHEGQHTLEPVETGGPGRRYREMARTEAKLRKIAFRGSQLTFRLGRKAEAKRLSEIRKDHDKKAKQFNAHAAADIFAHQNPDYNSGFTSPLYLQCDLHGLYVEEALQYALDHLSRCRKAGVKNTMLIVGKGSHSQEGGAKIRPAIMQMLGDVCDVVATLHETNEGRIVVEFLRIF